MALIDSLISYWEFDETSGTRVDATGNHNLTDNNGVTRSAGIISHAATFASASSQFLSVADHADFRVDPAKGISIAAWVNFASNSSVMTIVGKDTNSPANSRDYFLDFDGTVGTPVMRFAINGGTTLGNDIVLAPLTPTPGTWYFVTATFDPASTNQMRLAINDLAVVFTADATGFTPADTGSAPFTLGARSYASFEDYLDGSLAEVGFWNRVLDLSEITALYNGGAGMSAADIGIGAGATLETLDGPASGFVGHQSADFTVDGDGDISGVTTTPTTDGTGAFIPSSLMGAGTFKYVSLTAETCNINCSNDGGLTPPDDIAFTSTVGTPSGGGRLVNGGLVS